MAEILPYRRRRQWARASDYGAPRARPQARSRSGPRRRARGGWLQAARESGPILWAAPLALFLAVFFAERGIAAWGGWLAPSITAQDRHSAHFGRCAVDLDNNCVIDGDTFWFRGDKIRIADINTPETGTPKCAYEAELGARATARLQRLLNAGPFSLESIDRSHDTYGRALYVVTRDGSSLGNALVSEGLAERWQGYRREWC